MRKYKHKRGGFHLSTGRVGYVHPIRQQILTPGERLNVKIAGSVRMEALRERDNLRMNANLSVFMTPIRWLDTNWPAYLSTGTGGGAGPSTTSLIGDNIGLGGTTEINGPEFWLKAPERIYNEWYKWPEDPDATWLYTDDGLKAQNLEAVWTRMRDTDPELDAGNISTATGDEFHVYELREKQAYFEETLKREVLTYGRYTEMLQQVYGTDGTREVDKVPVLVHQENVGLQARNLSATDAAGLGQFTSLYDFGVNDMFKVIAPEHSILTYMLTIRFLPITEEVHPFLHTHWTNLELRGDPESLGVMRPQLINTAQVFDTTTTTDLGYAPGGWQWRTRNNVIGAKIKRRNSFPYLEQPTTPATARDATRIGTPFRSQSLEDFIYDLNFMEDSVSCVPPAGGSYMDDSRGYNEEMPFIGKVQ